MTGLPPVAIVLACLSLAPFTRAAAPEPTEADIMLLVEQDVERANTPIVDYHQRLGKGSVPEDMLVRLNAVRKKRCEPAGAHAWQCEVEMDMTVPNGGFRSRTVQLRLARTADGWQASRSR